MTLPQSDPRVNRYISEQRDKLQDMSDFNGLNVLNQLDNLWEYIENLEWQIKQLQAQITRTAPQPAAPDDDPPDPPSCGWCDGTGTTLTGKVEDCPYCNGTGYADGKPRTYGTVEPPQPAAPEPTLTPAEAAHFAAMAEERDAAPAPPDDGEPTDAVYRKGQKVWSLADDEYGIIEGDVLPSHTYLYITLPHNQFSHMSCSRNISDIVAERPAPTPRPVKLTDAERETLARPYKTGRVNGGNAVHFISEYGTPLCGSGKSSHMHNFRRATVHFCTDAVTCKKCQQYDKSRAALSEAK